MYGDKVMNRLFFDYTGDSLGNEQVKFHGGGDFSRFVLWKIKEYLAHFENPCQMILLWPKGAVIEELSPDEKRIRDTFEFLDVDSLSEVDYEAGDILFLPLLDCLSVSRIGQVRRKNSKLKIYGVLHGLRLLDVCRYDKYDRYYYSGVKSIPLVLWGRRWLAGILARRTLKKNLPCADRIYTVSNHSMQRINGIADAKYIKYFTRNVSDEFSENASTAKKEERFMLFVNANRYEKNFIRTLAAFCKFHKEYDSEIKLYVLGASELLKNNLKKMKEIDQEIVDSQVVYWGYVSSEQLRSFYRDCEFLLYTSKSEGYGLPPLEAMNAGRPSVVSSTTSVPEVLGMGAYYVNPFQMDDIVRGMAFMSKAENQEKYVDFLGRLKPSLHIRGEEDVNCLVRELFEEGLEET